MITKEDIVKEAKTWEGTPFHHQGRLKGVGVDCAGLVIGVSRALDLCPDFVDEIDYARIPDGRVKILLEKYLIKIPFADRQEGDIVSLAWVKEPQHVAILTKMNTIIHAYGLGNKGKVVETTLAGKHLASVRGIYRFPEVMI
jgi:cell wall-associated NlpC family hydrolase